MEEYLAQPRYREEGLCPALSDMTNILCSPWKASPSLRNGWGVGWGEGEGVKEGGRGNLDCHVK